MIEARAVRVGSVRIGELRSLGAAFRPGTEVRVLVLGAPGEPPAVEQIVLTEKLSGSRRHVAFACPRCGAAALVLHAFGGQLVCGCARLTRHQREANLDVYAKLGGREEDRLLRLVQRRQRSHEAARPELVQLVHTIVSGDRDRLALLTPRILAALEVTPWLPS